MNFSSKIDEWIAEAEIRPASALMILKLVANRLRDLAERNEALLTENIALQDGSRVQEYQQRIRHLEHQLEMLKGGSAAPTQPQAQTAALLLYNPQGRILRLNVNPGSPNLLGIIQGDLTHQGDFPRLLAVSPQEELLLLFSSGRIATLSAAQIPAVAGQAWAWSEISAPQEPHAGESLASILPLRRLPLASFFVQASRRGCFKKTPLSLSQSIFANQYLGRGAVQKSDRAQELLLCDKDSLCALVTWEGRLLAMQVGDLPYSAEESLRLSPTDFAIAALAYEAPQTLLFFTQNGKVLQREAQSLEQSKTAGSRGQALLSASRLQQGLRLVGAAAVQKDDAIVAVDAEGRLTLLGAEQAAGEGTLHASASILSIGILPAWGAEGAQA